METDTQAPLYTGDSNNAFLSKRWAAYYLYSASYEQWLGIARCDYCILIWGQFSVKEMQFYCLPIETSNLGWDPDFDRYADHHFRRVRSQLGFSTSKFTEAMMTHDFSSSINRSLPINMASMNSLLMSTPGDREVNRRFDLISIVIAPNKRKQRPTSGL